MPLDSNAPALAPYGCPMYFRQHRRKQRPPPPLTRNRDSYELQRLSHAQTPTPSLIPMNDFNKTLHLAASAIANARGMHRGAPLVGNILDILPNNLRAEVVEDAEAVLSALAEARPKIVCLCGSTRFGEVYELANLRETLAGKIVLSVGYTRKSDTELMTSGELTEAAKIALDELHKRKIDLADEILVLNVGGYIGDSTRSEIEYAQAHGKTVRWLESPCAE